MTTTIEALKKAWAQKKDVGTLHAIRDALLAQASVPEGKHAQVWLGEQIVLHAPLKVELRKFVANEKFSEETLMFRAEIYLDGKRVGFVENEGRGGSCNDSYDNSEAARLVSAWTKLQAPTPFSEDDGSVTLLDMNADYFFSRLADEKLRKKDDARIAKRLQKDADRFRAQGLTPMKFAMRDTRGTESFIVMGLRPDQHPSSAANRLMKKYKVEVLSSEAMP